jgi:rubrerythrin
VSENTAGLNTTQTLTHLKDAYRREAQANMRYLFSARLADAARRPDIANVLRAAADEEKGHALGFLDLLVEFRSETPELVCEQLEDNLRASIEAELHEFTALYGRYAEVATQEGFPDIASWFLELAKAGRTHALWLQQCLDGLEKS